MTDTIESIIDTLQEGLISPIEALMWLSRHTTVADHDPVYHVMVKIIHHMDANERKEMDNVYGLSQN